MAQLRIERVNALPNPLVASTMYIVAASDASLAEVVFTNNDGSAARHVINKTDVQAMIAEAVGSLQNILVVADIPARNALTPSQNELVLVLDATGDTTVNQGAALYLYDLANTTWVKVAEYESLDVTLDWASIQNGPTSSPAAIDAAVSQAHTHDNKAVLDDLGDDNGNLSYKGQVIGNTLANAEW